MDLPKSDCCGADINQDNEWGDICSECKNGISYALVGHWAAGFGNSYAVCKLKNGDYFYYWQSVSHWKSVLEHLSYEKYIGQIQERWSIQIEMDAYGDQIDTRLHKAFSDRWKHLVKNPEYAMP